MSLINDALKRAREAQPQSPPPQASLQLRPAEPAPAANRGMGMIVPAVIAFLALIGVFFVWHAERRPPVKQPAPETKATPPAAPKIAPPVQIAAVAPTPTPPAAPVPALPPVEPLKLQAIFFAPGHSSAIINGKTVFAGETFKGYRVADIAETSATLVSATETNVMRLDQ